MSFNRLPTEIKQLIVDQAAYSDQAYRKRVPFIRESIPDADSDSDSSSSSDSDSESDPDLLPNSHDETLGRTIQMLSKVNKEVRKLCYSHLFSVLLVSRCRTNIFQRTILDSSIVNSVTTLEIDSKASLDSLAFALFHVCARLPNLSTLKFTAHVAHALLKRPTGDGTFSEQREIHTKFFQLAKRITRWDIHCNSPEQTLPYLQSNPSIVTTLTLRGAHKGSLVRDSRSPVPPALARLSSLQQLVLKFSVTNSSNGRLIHQSALKIDYSFRNTLKSLIVTIPSLNKDSKHFDPKLLEFAALFPSLRRLRLDFTRSPTLTPKTSSIVLSKLVSLEIRCYNLSSANEILRVLRLDHLAHLKLEFHPSYNLAHSSLLSSEMDKFTARLESFRRTLKFFRIDHPIGMYKNVWKQLIEKLGDGTQTFKNWIDGTAESVVDPEKLNEEERQFVQLVDVLGKAVAEMADWSAENLKKMGEAAMKEGDLGQIKTWWDDMSDMKDRRRWQEE